MVKKSITDLDFYIGQNIKTYRKSKNMAKKELAFLLKITYVPSTMHLRRA